MVKKRRGGEWSGQRRVRRVKRGEEYLDGMRKKRSRRERGGGRNVLLLMLISNRYNKLDAISAY